MGSYDHGDFQSVEKYIRNVIISEEKAVSMTVLHNIFGLSPGDDRYRNKLKKRIEKTFPNELLFVKAKEKTPEIVVSRSILENTVHRSIDMNATIIEVASLLRQDIISQCKTFEETNWPPNVEELEARKIPDSVELFLTNLLKSKNSTTNNNENTTRLIDSYAADMVHGVTHGKVLTKKHFLLALGIHSITGMKDVVKIINRLGHCINYDKTCEIETAMAEATIARSSNINILPVVPVEDEVVLTYFWVDNFDANVESQKGGGSIHTTHMMAFQETTDQSPLNNTNCGIKIPPSKRRRVAEVHEKEHERVLLIDPNHEPPKFADIIQPNFDLIRFSSYYFLWLCFRKWNSYDQTISTFSGWYSQVIKKRSPNNKLAKTVETYLPPINSKITDFASIRKYMDYLKSLAASVNMPYVNITLDVGAAVNAFKFIWNDTDTYGDIFIHLGDFHFIKENFQVNLALHCCA